MKAKAKAKKKSAKRKLKAVRNAQPRGYALPEVPGLKIDQHIFWDPQRLYGNAGEVRQVEKLGALGAMYGAGSAGDAWDKLALNWYNRPLSSIPPHLKVWRTKDGEETNARKMSTSHVGFALAMLIRNRDAYRLECQDRGVAATRTQSPFIQIFSDELALRAKEGRL